MDSSPLNKPSSMHVQPSSESQEVSSEGQVSPQTTPRKNGSASPATVEKKVRFDLNSVSPPTRTISSEGIAPPIRHSFLDRTSMIEETMISDIYLCTPQHRRGLEKKRPNPVKLKKVQQWLKSKYGRNPIPKWEKTSETVDLLYDIAIHNEQQDEILPYIEEEEEKISQEYRLEAQSMENCLNDIGLFIEDFQEEGSPLNTLVAVAEKLGLADLEISSFFEGILDFSERQNELSLLNSTRDTDIEAVHHFIGKLNDAKNRVEREILALDGEKEYNEALFSRFEIQNTEMEKWIKQIRDKISTIESEIIPECKDLSISSLWKLDNQIREAKQQLRNQHKQIKTYLDLPPDLELAKMKVESKQTELEQLNQQREALISKMADGIQ
ncbi:hypothetical protein K493DRAFT_338306 [Basidiobolus meristosporus CBS 931.73]|uniref:Uncharacterized protein n=1 Tax=Basidiobolus meristosporus CBS 931.73 TaxID=1314790 RepID=A0A1Y1Y747_9FUNG|nr:hypothetical protein K493DRAFT_338306 [Basidiobolus meristosporus CBS 931.73]|eukprot:ORX93404.1 hypothetical protein K493DRAFT_338306 [Basidiobolus meristosporus CBS 931.73]